MVLVPGFNFAALQSANDYERDSPVAHEST